MHRIDVGHGHDIYLGLKEREMKMKFVEELQQSETKKTVERAVNFAHEIKPSLIASAEKGFTGHKISLYERDDAHILKKDLFIKTLEENLDGCKVTRKTEEYTHLIFKTTYSKEFIVISWR